MAKSRKETGGPVNAGRLKSFVDRVENLEGERKGISDDIRDVYSEAKGVGFDVKTMRLIVRERKADVADLTEQETLLDTYRHALGMPGATYRSVADEHGISKSKLHRLVPREKDGTAREMTADDLGEVPAAILSGESNEGDPERRSDPVGCDGADTNSDAAPRGIASCPVTPQAAVVQHVPVTPVPDGGVGAGTSLVTTNPGALCAAHPPPPAEMTVTVSVGAVAEPSAAPRVAPEIIDDLKFPPFLARGTAA